MNHKIGIDFTYILEDEVTGIRKYGEGFLEGLIKLNNNIEFILFVNDFMEDVFKKKFPSCKVVPVKFFFKNMRNIRYFRIVNALGIAKSIRNSKIKKEDCELIIYPYVSRYTPVIENQVKIITIQDVIPLDEIKDKESAKYKKVKEENVKLMNKSKYLLTISEYSKKRLIEINPEYDGEITVIPNSIEKLKESGKDVSGIINTDKPYIFSVNSFFKHKNQITLVKAFNSIKEKIPHKLVLVGRPELNTPISNYNNVMEYIEKNDLKDRVEVLSYISDEDRNALFYGADLFVTTSCQEGFGRTPVEAAICKVPVISTKETSLPEVTMNEVFYYENATDSEELAKKTLEVINNRPSKEKLEEIAKKFEEEYREENIAKRYMELVNKVLEENNN